MAVSKRLRYEVMRRDNHTCRYCGSTAPDVKLAIDHVIPVTLGGSDDPSNLVASCVDCNSGKSSITPDAALVAEVDRRALAWSAAMQRVAEVRAQQREDRQELWSWFNEIWCRWEDWRGEPFDAPGDWIDTVARFLESGLTPVEVEEMVRVSMRTKSVRDKWRYFCGCCNTRIRQNIDMAAEIAQQMESDDGA